MDKLYIALGILAILAVAGYAFMSRKPYDETIVENWAINSFEECAAAGNPVQESYPRRCRAQDGRTFTEEVGVLGDEPMDGMADEDGSDDMKAVAGTIIAIDTEQTAVDGPARITIASDGGGEAVIAIPVFFAPESCPGMANVADYATLAVGDSIEARGGIGPMGEVVPCASAEHYVRVAE